VEVTRLMPPTLRPGSVVATSLIMEGDGSLGDISIQDALDNVEKAIAAGEFVMSSNATSVPNASDALVVTASMAGEFELVTAPTAEEVYVLARDAEADERLAKVEKRVINPEHPANIARGATHEENEYDLIGSGSDADAENADDDLSGSGADDTVVTSAIAHTDTGGKGWIAAVVILLLLVAVAVGFVVVDKRNNGGERVQKMMDIALGWTGFGGADLGSNGGHVGSVHAVENPMYDGLSGADGSASQPPSTKNVSSFVQMFDRSPNGDTVDSSSGYLEVGAEQKASDPLVDECVAPADLAQAEETFNDGFADDTPAAAEPAVAEEGATVVLEAERTVAVDANAAKSSAVIIFDNESPAGVAL